MGIIDKAVSWAVEIANDNSHGYSQNARWGPSYDCSSFVISAFDEAGLSVKDKGANSTANMKQAFLSCGFEDVTANVNLSNGSGMKKGDVLLNENGRGASARSNGHAALVRLDGGSIVHASNPTNGILTRGYYNYPWDCVLRYTKDESGADKETFFADTNEVISIHPRIFTLSDIVIDGDFAVYINNKDVTPSIGPLNIKSTLQELATTVSINIAKSDARFTYLYVPSMGDIVRIFTPGEIFRGVILSDDTGKRHQNGYTAVDIGWYLSKNKDTYQFNNIDAYDAVYKLFADLGIPILYISESLKGHPISGVYMDKAISEILEDILAQVSGDWNYDIAPKGARVYPVGTFVSEPKFRTSPNTAFRSSVKYRGEETRTSSIMDMKNAVKVISDTNVLKRVGDNESYNNFGLLQEVLKIDPEKENADEIADAKLAELSRGTVSRSFPLIVEMSDNTHAGDLLVIEGERHIVKSADHNIKNGRHSLTVEVEKI